MGFFFKKKKKKNKSILIKKRNSYLSISINYFCYNGIVIGQPSLRTNSNTVIGNSSLTLKYLQIITEEEPAL